MVSFIISYFEEDIYRRRNLDFIVGYLKKLSIEGSEVIVVEQGKTQHYKDSVFIHSHSMFNKGLGYNKGATIAKNNILFFSDADIVMPTHNYYDAIDSLINCNFDVVDPYREINYCDEKVSSDIIKGVKNTNYISRVRSGVITGGAFVIRKSVFMAVKGFDENCVGYGYEDTILDIKLNKMEYKINRLIDFCIHLYHPSHSRNITNQTELDEFIKFTKSSGDGYYSNFLNNKALSEKYTKFTKEELINHINE